MEDDNHREETSSGLGFASSKEKRISKDKNKLESKKTYKDKIKGIIVQSKIKATSVGQSQQEQQFEVDVPSEDLECDGYDKISNKNEKSRLSAKMTRKRRKIYIEMVEKQNQMLQEELLQAKEKIKTFEATQKQNQNSEIMSQLLQERHKLFEKLEQKIKEKDETEIQCTMDSLRLRLGVSGKTRNQALNSFFEDIIRLIMPFHMKYLIWIAIENLDIFNAEKDSDSSDSNWFKNSGMTEEQKAQIREQILKSKEDYDDIITQLDFLKRRMSQANENAQNFIDDLRNYFPPINIAKFLISLDKKRTFFEEQNIYPAQFWSDLQQVKNNQLTQPISNKAKRSTTSNLLPAVTTNSQQPIPSQNKPTAIFQSVEQNINSFQNNNESAIKHEVQGQNSLNSSQCSFSMDQFNRQAEYLSRLSSNNNNNSSVNYQISKSGILQQQQSNIIPLSNQARQIQLPLGFNSQILQGQQPMSDQHGVNQTFALQNSPQQISQQYSLLGPNSLFLDGRNNNYEGDYSQNCYANGQKFNLGQNQAEDLGGDSAVFSKYYDLNPHQFIHHNDQH